MTTAAFSVLHDFNSFLCAWCLQCLPIALYVQILSKLFFFCVALTLSSFADNRHGRLGCLMAEAEQEQLLWAETDNCNYSREDWRGRLTLTWAHWHELTYRNTHSHEHTYMNRLTGTHTHSQEHTHTHMNSLTGTHSHEQTYRNTHTHTHTLTWTDFQDRKSTRLNSSHR